MKSDRVNCFFNVPVTCITSPLSFCSSLSLSPNLFLLCLSPLPQVTDRSVFKTQMYKMSMAQELREARSSQYSKLFTCVSLCACLSSSHCYLLWCLFSSSCFLGSPLLFAELSYPLVYDSSCPLHQQKMHEWWPTGFGCLVGSFLMNFFPLSFFCVFFSRGMFSLSAEDSF